MSSARSYAERYDAGEVCIEGCDEPVNKGEPCHNCEAERAAFEATGIMNEIPAVLRPPPYINCVRIDQPENAGRHPAPDT